MSDTNTLPGLLARNASRWPHRPAWRHKRLGIWQTQNWSAFARRCDGIAAGLAAQGFARGDRLAVCGDNRPDLYAALLAAQSLGGVGVPLDPDAEPARLTEILRDARISVAIADSVEQAERLRSVADALPSPPRVFCADTGGLHRHDAWEQASVDALVAGRIQGACPPLAVLGREADQGWPEAGSSKRSVPHDLALLLYAAAPNSHPLALSHAQLLAAAAAIADLDPVRPTDATLCYLPMNCYDDALYSLTLGLLGGFTCNCPEAPDSVPRDLREIGPTILFAPPAACAALAQLVIAKADAVSGFKRRCFGFFQRQALRADSLRERGRPMPPGLAILCRIGELVAYAPLRDQLGLSKARWVHTGTPLPPDTARLLRAFGIALRPATARTAAPGPVRETPETLHA